MMRLQIRFSLIALFAVLAAGTAHAQLGEGSNRRFVRAMSGIETCLACHGSYNIVEDIGSDEHSLWISADLFFESVHNDCTMCHTGIDPRGHRIDTGSPTISGRGCLPCHDEAANNINDTEDDNEALSQLALGRRVVSDALRACITCHPGEYLEYKDSIHGVDVLQNMEQDPPFCTDCHGSHYILRSEDERAWTNPDNVPKTCLKCHGEATIQSRFGLTKDVGGTFEESFHGKRGEAGGSVAVCTTCHGSHQVFASTDPRSKVNALRVASTCGECHEGAQLNFASAFTHGQVSRTELTGLYAVVQTHKWMIVTVIAPLMFIVFTDLFRMLRLRREKKHA